MVKQKMKLNKKINTQLKKVGRRSEKTLLHREYMDGKYPEKKILNFMSGKWKYHIHTQKWGAPITNKICGLI